MANPKETVELPASGEIKQIAHDVIRDENEYAIPLLQDFHDFISRLDEENHASYSDLTVENPESQIDGTAWRNFLETLEEQGVVEKHPSGTTTFTLAKNE